MKNYIYLDGKKIEISDETAENLKKQFSKKEIEKGTIYLWIDSLNEKNINSWGNDEIDNNRLQNHNVYLNEADCDLQIEKNEALNKIKTYIKDNFGNWEPDWNNLDEKKWSVYYDYDYEYEKWGTQEHHCCRELVLIPYLKSKEQALQLIKDCEEELNILIK